MSLHEQIKKGAQTALKEKDASLLKTLRSILAALTNEAITQKKKPSELLDDETVLVVIGRLAKQRRESIEQFEKGGRKELAAEEKEELTHLEEYLPQMIGEDDIKAVVEKKKTELSITDKSGMGQLMGAVMQELKGKADGTMVKKVVDQLFE
ncbi:glutamyl-tRNA amidotransferase [bacterium]|nr:glutamyl-tRNA amidotransferase [bacterium]|tara:strand:+ start:21898 stop:22353 length:456 start_codon:yes stop_codon:yes gene_type:complete